MGLNDKKDQAKGGQGDQKDKGNGKDKKDQAKGGQGDQKDKGDGKDKKDQAKGGQGNQKDKKDKDKKDKNGKDDQTKKDDQKKKDDEKLAKKDPGDGKDKDKDKDGKGGGEGKDKGNGDGGNFGKNDDRKNDKNTIAAQGKDVWGHLPQNRRKEMDAFSRQRFMPQYEELLRAYYRNIAESGQRRNVD